MTISLSTRLRAWIGVWLLAGLIASTSAAIGLVAEPGVGTLLGVDDGPRIDSAAEPSFVYDDTPNPVPAAVTDDGRSRALERHVADAAGPSLASSDGLVAPRGAGLGDDFWRATNVGPNRAGTLVPESFDLAVGGQKFTVHPNATKHMAEYATSHQISQVPLSSFAGSVESALGQGLRPGRNFLQVGPWELGIDTRSNVIYHAVYRPG